MGGAREWVGLTRDVLCSLSTVHVMEMSSKDDVFKCDIFHPNTTFDVDELSWPGSLFVPSSQCVLFQGKLYVGGVLAKRSRRHQRLNVLWSFTPDFRCCSQSEVPTKGYGLATYDSQLVLIGGMDPVSKKASSKLWRSFNGIDWNDGTLPPMPTPKLTLCAASFGNPECLLVIGGYKGQSDSVELLKEGQWFVVERLPVLFSSLQCALHKGNVYLSKSDTVVCCSLEALLKTCLLPEREQKSYHLRLWKTLKIPHNEVCLVSFKDQLLAFCLTAPSSILAFSPDGTSWINVGSSDLATSIVPGYCVGISLPSGNLLVFMKNKIFRISARVSLFHMDDRFSVSALHRLEAAGVPVVTSLKMEIENNPGQISRILYRQEEWAKEWEKGACHLPPTWRSLFEMLKELDLEDLSQEVQTYLTGAQSLRKMCRSVIMSALLEQKLLDPVQLPARLPDYVPTALKRSITDTFALVTSHTRHLRKSLK